MSTDPKIEIVWNQSFSAISGRIINNNVRLFAANEAKRLMTPYVPANNLVLTQNTSVYVDGKSGIVHYKSPYAHYQYEGKLYVSSVTGSPWARHGEYKVRTERDLRYQKHRHPLATSHWDKAMLASRKSDLVSAIENYISTM